MGRTDLGGRLNRVVSRIFFRIRIGLAGDTSVPSGGRNFAGMLGITLAGQISPAGEPEAPVAGVVIALKPALSNIQTVLIDSMEHWMQSRSIVP